MRLKFWIGILISGCFLYFFARDINWSEVGRILKSIHYGYVLITILVNVLVYVLRAERWKYLLLPLKRIKFSSVLSATVIGFMANNVLPLRLGEIARAYLIGQREGISKSSSLATVVVERLFDSVVVLMFFIGLMIFLPFPPGFERNELINPQNLKKMGMAAGGAFVVVMAFVLIARFHFQKMNDLLGKILLPRFSHLHETIAKGVESFSRGMDCLFQGKHLLSIAIYSVLLWLTISLSFYSLYPAFELHLPFISAVLMVVIVALAVAVPSSPGFVGVFHFACAACLILFGVEPNKAKSFALILHGVVFVPVTVSGLLLVYFDKIDLKQLQSLENNGNVG